MCVIYCATTKLPEDSELLSGGIKNDDGAGVAWLGNSPTGVPTPFYQKGLATPKDVKEFIKDSKLPLPLVIHFRTVSAGGKMKELTHPFPVSAEAETALAGSAPQLLFQNGHVAQWEDLLLKAAWSTSIPFPDGAWSDTRALAWITHLKGTSILPFIIGTSRVAILEEAKNYGSPGYSRERDHIRVWNYSSWIKKDGYIQSIETSFKNKGGVVIYSRSAFDKAGLEALKEVKCSLPQAPEPPVSLEEEEGNGWGRSTGLQTGSTNPPSGSSVVQYPTDNWTVEEFKAILAKCQEEVKNAQTAAGL